MVKHLYGNETMVKHLYGNETMVKHLYGNETMLKHLCGNETMVKCAALLWLLFPSSNYYSFSEGPSTGSVRPCKTVAKLTSLLLASELALLPVSHPAFCHLQYEKQSAASAEKLDEGLGTRP